MKLPKEVTGISPASLCHRISSISEPKHSIESTNCIRRVSKSHTPVSYILYSSSSNLAYILAAHEQTFQDFSSFISTYKNEQYEQRLVAASKLRAAAVKAWEQRDPFEIRLVRPSILLCVLCSQFAFRIQPKHHFKFTQNTSLQRDARTPQAKASRVTRSNLMNSSPGSFPHSTNARSLKPPNERPHRRAELSIISRPFGRGIWTSWSVSQVCIAPAAHSASLAYNESYSNDRV